MSNESWQLFLLITYSSSHVEMISTCWINFSMTTTVSVHLPYAVVHTGFCTLFRQLLLPLFAQTHLSHVVCILQPCNDYLLGHFVLLLFKNSFFSQLVFWNLELGFPRDLSLSFHPSIHPWVPGCMDGWMTVIQAPVVWITVIGWRCKEFWSFSGPSSVLLLFQTVYYWYSLFSSSVWLLILQYHTTTVIL